MLSIDIHTYAYFQLHVDFYKNVEIWNASQSCNHVCSMHMHITNASKTSLRCLCFLIHDEYVIHNSQCIRIFCCKYMCAYAFFLCIFTHILVHTLSAMHTRKFPTCIRIPRAVHIYLYPDHWVTVVLCVMDDGARDGERRKVWSEEWVDPQPYRYCNLLCITVQNWWLMYA